MDVHDPRFNIVSPGADASIFFSYTEADRRLTSLHASIRDMIHGPETPGTSRGTLADDARPILFTMARLDTVKNLVGLAEWYAHCPRLQAAASLLIVGGAVDPEQATDAEAAEQGARLHALFDSEALPAGKARWVVAQPNAVRGDGGRRARARVGGLRWRDGVACGLGWRDGLAGGRAGWWPFSTRNPPPPPPPGPPCMQPQIRNGEVYRYIADGRGAFCQPALYEAFGLTVVEAMTSGLPVFATNRGGPAEIIKHGISGFHIDPYHGAEAAAAMADFFEACAKDPGETGRWGWVEGQHYL